MGASQPVLLVEGLTRRFGEVVANNEVSLEIRAGEVVGLLGHNGAGKTTLVSQIVGLLRPDSGHITVAGVDAVQHPAIARRAVALQPQAQAPLDGLTPRSAIEIAAALRGLGTAEVKEATERLAAELDITEWLDRRAMPEGAGISGGVRRLTGFAMAAVAPTPLVVLDEPTNDVDAGRRRRLWSAVRRLADDGAGVLLVTHNVAEAERVVDELVILDRGNVVAAGTPAQLRGDSDVELRLELHLRPDGTDPSHDGGPPVAIHRRVRAGRKALLNIPVSQAAEAVTWASELVEEAVIESYALTPASLEDSYLAITGSPNATEESNDV